jgi:hypothetical protein
VLRDVPDYKKVKGEDILKELNILSISGRTHTYNT